MTFRQVRLDEIAEVRTGDPAPQNPDAFADEGPMFVRMQDVGRDHINPELVRSTDQLSSDWLRTNRLRLFPKNSILIPKSGASVNLNHRAKLAEDAYVVSHLAVVIPDPQLVDPEYLFWWSVKYDPRRQVQVTSLPSLKTSMLKEAKVPLPPLEEQRRIVDILNRAASIERLRACASAQLRALIPALFIKMFGDPITNPMGWEAMPLGDLVVEFRYGTSKKCTNELTEGSLPVLRIPNVIHDQINWTDLKYTKLSSADANRLLLRSGDLLFVRTNGNPEYIGRCAQFEDGDAAAFASYLIRARLKESAPARASYVARLMSIPSMRQQILRLARTTAGNYNINIESLGSLAIPLPPLDQQQRYADLISRIQDMLRLLDRSAEEAHALSQALMARLFSTEPQTTRNLVAQPQRNGIDAP